MNSIRIVAAIACAVLTAQAPGDQLLVQPLMKDVVAVQAQAIWDVGNNAMDDDGKPDASRISTADWSKLAKAAAGMHATAQAMAEAKTIHVAPPGVKLQDEGGPGAATQAQIQSFIDANQPAFAKRSSELAALAGQLATAAASRDAVRLVDASGQLDQVCEACHKQFWYPGQ